MNCLSQLYIVFGKRLILLVYKVLVLYGECVALSKQTIYILQCLQHV